jgi:hypothetical protein
MLFPNTGAKASWVGVYGIADGTKTEFLLQASNRPDEAEQGKSI